jgi:phosphoribosylformylglycinamidine cyclo-ligase/phosphoribosylamine--glycine ligase/phosphoribosylformylglycinamidine cyclo-ligase
MIAHMPNTPAAGATYAGAGVNIDAGNTAVDLMKAAVQSTYTPAVLAGIGSFGGLFDGAALKAMESPVLVASTDGVGTKVKLAAQFGRFEGIGRDIVNHCINDILVQGAKPLFFLDYFATSKLHPQQVADVVSGIAAACREAGCALLGGETAEMPGVYVEGAFDVAGTVVGVVERNAIWPRKDEMQAGDVLIGLASSGPHTNGYSLIRKILNSKLEIQNSEWIDALLQPHRSYLSLIERAKAAAPIKGLAHLTGGGFIENIPRVLPAHLHAEIDYDAWQMPDVFKWLQAQGNISDDEMHRVFNCGIGMVMVVAPEHVAATQSALGEPAPVIGKLNA